MRVTPKSSNTRRAAAGRQNITAAAAAVLALLVIGCAGEMCPPAFQTARAQRAGRERPSAESDYALEAAQTRRLLGVPVRDFPPPQGPTGFDELPPDASAFRFTLTRQAPSGARPRASYEERPRVEARGPDGSVYEAYLGHDDPEEIAPGHGFVSTSENRRQRYDTHHGYEYSPRDVFVGKREAGRLKPTLFFRDVGSHTTAPHHLAVDRQGQVHLSVADVNISQDNRLDLYRVIGDPASRKWTAAWLVDRRGFTSWSHPWSAAWGEKVHLLWTWCDVSVNKRAPGMGAFHLEWTPTGVGRKVRVVRGVVETYDAAVDPRTGRLLLVFSKDDGVYVISRAEGGGWTRAARLHPRLRGRHEVAVEASGGGAFRITTSSGSISEWLLRPR